MPSLLAMGLRSHEARAVVWCLIAACLLCTLSACSKPDVLPSFGQVPAFTLFDQTGQLKSRRLFDGHSQSFQTFSPFGVNL